MAESKQKIFGIQSKLDSEITNVDFNSNRNTIRTISLLILWWFRVHAHPVNVYFRGLSRNAECKHFVKISSLLISLISLFWRNFLRNLTSSFNVHDMQLCTLFVMHRGLLHSWTVVGRSVAPHTPPHGPSLPTLAGFFLSPLMNHYSTYQPWTFFLKHINAFVFTFLFGFHLWFVL